jgi:broad specificity phosphatase PhoE
MEPIAALGELASYNRFKTLMLVGHEPDLSSLIATLLGMGKSISLSLPKASLTAIEAPRLTPASGILQFLLPVKFL